MPDITIDTSVPSPQAVVAPRLATVLRGYEERTDVALTHDLHAGGAAVTVPVTIQTRCAEPGTPTAIPLLVHATHHTAWFPSFRGEVRSEAVGPLESILRLDGTYQTPLGAIGNLVDATVLGHAAERTLRSFLDRIRSDVIDEIRRAELSVRVREGRSGG
jgi:hypothetical protein